MKKAFNSVYINNAFYLEELRIFKDNIYMCKRIHKSISLSYL